MDTASLDFLSPLLDGIDHWSELAPLLPVLVLLELILSADNAVALASIAKRLDSIELQQVSLNIGIFISLIFRILLILLANIIIKYPFIQIIASLYLLTLVINHFYPGFFNIYNHSDVQEESPISFLKITSLLALTDLAFSIDSVTAAVAISDQLLLVITGTFVGVVALRFTADLFIRWLDEFINLESAGYLAVLFVAIKLLGKSFVFHDEILDYLFYFTLLITFIWGFSSKKGSESS